MNNTSQISSISLTFNDSWLAYMGSRIYRLAIETIELVSTVFSYPLVQPYSGRRLYELLDTFCDSVRNNDSYNQARINYADDLIKALGAEKNIFAKTKAVRTILNTNIIGISILQNKDKQLLSDHVGFTVLPALINGFGEEMANRAFLALDELNNKSEKDLNQYAKSYKDLALHQSDIEDFVKMLQGLNSNVPREILIHELVLARNEHLTDAAKAKITSILQNRHYIDVQLQRKLELTQRLQNQKKVDEKELTRELKTYRDTQLETLNYTNSSMFSPEELAIGTLEEDTDSTIADDEPVDNFKDTSKSFEATPSDETIESESPATESTPIASDKTRRAESSTPEITTETNPTVTLEPFESPEMPVGITNPGINSCWYNAALQLLYNTSLFHEVVRKQDKLFKNFPNIAQSLKAYDDYYREQADIRRLENPSRFGTSEELMNEIERRFEEDPNLLKKVRSYRNTPKFAPLDLAPQMQKIRSEIHHKVNAEFEDSGIAQEDSKLFLFSLLQKLSIDVSQITTLSQDIYDLTSKYVFFHKPAAQAFNEKELLFGTNYVIKGMIIHSGTDEGGHYYSAVHRNQNWYLCNDSSIEKISEERLQQELENNSAFIMATTEIVDNFEENPRLQPPQDSPSLLQWLFSPFRRT